MQLNERTRRSIPWVLLALGVVITAAVYWPGRTGGWVFDDFPNIVDNAAIHITRGHATLVAWVNAALSSPASFLHRPLASITFAANWMQGNGDPYPFKLTNIGIHLVNGVLVFVMLCALLRLLLARKGIPPTLRVDPLRSEGGEEIPAAGVAPRRPEGDAGIPPRLRRDPLPAEGGGQTAESAPGAGILPPSAGRGTEGDASAATRLALVVAVGWMLLPINLMAVLYVVQRMESLCQVFVLAGLWAYLHGRWMMVTAGGDAGRDRRGFAVAAGGIVFGTLLGLTSKETAVLLPVFAFLAEWIVLRFRRSFVSLRVEGIPPRLRRDPLPAEGGEGNSPTLRVDPLPVEGGGHAAEDARGAEILPPSVGRGTEGDAASTAAPVTRTDKRIWSLFTVTLFIPAVLGFLWLLRGALKPSAFAGRNFTLGQRLLTEPRVLVDYLHWTLFPNPDVLSLYHDEIVKSTGLLAPWTTLGAMVLLAALLAIALAVWKRRPLIALGILWFFGSQLLTATIVPLELVYEQRMYFGSIGVLLVAADLLLGLRWKIRWSLLRGFLVGVALLWFAVATNLRAQEWSNPIRLAVAEANRHPTSPRAVYEAGRLLLIAANYHPGKTLDASEKFLKRAAAIPGSSSLPDQALLMIVDHNKRGDDEALWQSMTNKLRNQPTRQEDVSALISLTNCLGADICKFDPAALNRAYLATLSRPHPIARLNGAYADFQRDILHNDAEAEIYLARAVAGDPSEPAYRVDLAALYARNGQTRKALEQIDALRRMNVLGRLNRQIAMLEQMAERGKSTQP